MNYSLEFQIEWKQLNGLIILIWKHIYIFNIYIRIFQHDSMVDWNIIILWCDESNKTIILTLVSFKKILWLLLIIRLNRIDVWSDTDNNTYLAFSLINIYLSGPAQGVSDKGARLGRYSKIFDFVFTTCKGLQVLSLFKSAQRFSRTWNLFDIILLINIVSVPIGLIVPNFRWTLYFAYYVKAKYLDPHCKSSL